MSFFNTLKNMASKAKCATGFHSGKFTQINGEPECFYEKTCPDCDKYLTKKTHKYSNWNDYKKPRNCFKDRECIYCDHTETKEFHAGYRQKGKDDYCTIIEECGRCGHTKKGREEHMWVKMPGNYEDEHVRFSCASCNKEKMRRKVKA